jgi:tellurite resistance protein TerC
MDIQNVLLTIFSVVIGGFLVADLGFFNKKAHKIEPKSALIQSLFWIAMAFAFAFLVFLYMVVNLLSNL